MPEKIVQGDLLYHSVHGLCRVNEVIKQNPANKDVSYSIVPKLPTISFNTGNIIRSGSIA